MEPQITFYTFPPSQNAARTEITLLEKGLAFEKIPVDLFTGANKKPPLSELTPRGQLPTLVYRTGEQQIVVYESIATIRFLDDMHPDPPLLPSIDQPQQRALAQMRIAEFQNKFDPKNIFGSVMFRGQTREELGKRVDALLAELTCWEGYIGDMQFLAGDAFGLADIAVFPLLMHFEVLGYDYAKHTPKLAAYMDRCKARPSVQKSGWLDVFASFVASKAPKQVLAD